MHIEGHSLIYCARHLESRTLNGSGVLRGCRPKQVRIPRVLVEKPRGSPNIRHQIVEHHEFHREKRRGVVFAEFGRLIRSFTFDPARSKGSGRQVRRTCKKVNREKSVRTSGSNANRSIALGVQLPNTLSSGRDGRLWWRDRDLCVSPGIWSLGPACG